MGRTLLLADDSVTIQKVVSLTFASEGVEIITASDGQEAIERLGENTPDVALLDVFMPKRDGYEVCSYIKQDERLGRIPVILLVGAFEPFDQEKARAAGADDYLTKPFQSIRQLVTKVNELLHPTPAPEAESETEAFAATAPEAENMVSAPPDLDLDDPSIEVTSGSHSWPEAEAPFEENVMEETFIPVEEEVAPVADLAEDGDQLLELDELQPAPLAETDDVLSIYEEIKLTLPPAKVEEPAPAEAFTEPVIVETSAEPEAAQAEPASPPAGELSPAAIEAIARRVVELMADRAVREIAWEVVPDLAELHIKRRMEETK
jgi:CheY-like chemotaxis protein